MSSQAVRDMQRVTMTNLPYQQEVNRYKGQFTSKIEDYATSVGDANIEFEGLSIPIQTPLSDRTDIHPLEVASRKERFKADIFRKLQPNQVLLTNLPVESDTLASAESVDNLLRKQVHKDL